MALINKGRRVKGKKLADDELCSLMLKGKSHERQCGVSGKFGCKNCLAKGNKSLE